MAASMYELRCGGAGGNKKAGQARFPSFPGHVRRRYIRGRHTVDQVKYRFLRGNLSIVSRRTFPACNSTAPRHMGIDCGMGQRGRTVLPSRRRQRDLEARAACGARPAAPCPDAPSTSAATMPSPMPVPPLSRRVVKNGSKMRARLLGEMPAPSSLTTMRDDVAARLPPTAKTRSRHGGPNCRRGWRARSRAFSADMRNRRSAPPSTSTRKPSSARQQRQRLGERRGLAGRPRGFRRAPARAAGAPAGSAGRRRRRCCREKRVPLGLVHLVAGIAQQLGRALDRGQRRFQLVRDMGGEGLDACRSAPAACAPCRGRRSDSSAISRVP